MRDLLSPRWRHGIFWPQFCDIAENAKGRRGKGHASDFETQKLLRCCTIENEGTYFDAIFFEDGDKFLSRGRSGLLADIT